MRDGLVRSGRAHRRAVPARAGHRPRRRRRAVPPPPRSSERPVPHPRAFRGRRASGPAATTATTRSTCACSRSRAGAASPTPDVAETRLGGAAIVPLGPFEGAADGAGERIGAPAGLTRERRVAGAARRVRGTRRPVRGRSGGRRRRRAGRAARRRTDRRRGRAEGPAPRQPHLVQPGAGRRGRARAGGDLARLAQPVSFSRRPRWWPGTPPAARACCAPTGTARSPSRYRPPAHLTVRCERGVPPPRRNRTWPPGR